MEELFKEFMKYLENASDEELRKNWEELKWCDEIGPTFTEYAKSVLDSNLSIDNYFIFSEDYQKSVYEIKTDSNDNFSLTA